MIACAPMKHSSPIDDAFFDAHAVADVARPPEHRAADARRRPDVDVVVHDGALEVRVGLHDDVVAEHGVRPQHRARLDAAVVADQHRRLDRRRRARRRRSRRATPARAPGSPGARCGPGRRGCPRARCGTPRACRRPPSSRRRRGRRACRPASSTAGNTSPEKSTTSPLGDVVEHAGLEHVDPGVDRVGEHLAPRRLLEEPLDRAVVAG